MLVDEQNGFRKACIDHIYAFTSIICARIKQNRFTIVCFIDFKKAFDWNNRVFLQYRLLNSGVNGKFYYTNKSLYQSSVFRVQVIEYTTGWFYQQFDVKQRGVLSSTLF